MIESVAGCETLEETVARIAADDRSVYVVRGRDKAELLESFATVLDFGDHYGRNLDALADCLLDIGSLAPATIVWDDAAQFEADQPYVYAAVIEILSTRLPRGVDAIQCRR